MSKSGYRAIAEFYDAEYEQSEMLRRDVPFLLSHMPKRPCDVLEMAVGSGRAAIPLAQAGHRVTGVDYDADILAIARRKRGFVGLGERQLKLVKADVLRVNLKRKFDWVVLLFNTFQNFTTIRQMDQFLQNCRRHLKPDGRLWIDVAHPVPELLTRKRWEKLDAMKFQDPSTGRTITRTLTIELDDHLPVQHMSFEYRWREGGKGRCETIQFDMTWVWPREMELLLERNGFDVIKMFGDHAGAAVSADSSRVIALAKLG